MRNPDRIRVLCGAFFAGLALVTVAVGSAGATGPDQTTALRGLAVMPFFIGKWTSDADEMSDRTLAQTVATLNEPALAVKEGAARYLTRLVFDWLRVRHSDQLAPLQTSREAFLQLSVDYTSDTPRKLARELGDKLSVKQVVVGTVWRFGDRDAIVGAEDSPASVAFAVYLVDVSTGQRLWRGRFDGTQKTLTEIAGNTSLQAVPGLKWLSAEELAKRGVQQVMKKFPLALPE